MKILINTFCNHCLAEAEQKGVEYNYDYTKSLLVELNELGLYQFKCPNNHIQWNFIQEHLFQILFDLGALALSDSYTREAVSSFATSLERFYEFVSKLILLADESSEKIVDEFWGNISKQSERQVGAFLSIYANKFKKVPTLPKNRWIKFRNDVTHNGIIPSESQTLEYGQLISDLIFDVLFDLKDFYKENINKQFHKVYQYNVKKIKEKYPDVDKASGSSQPTIIQLRSIQSPEFVRIKLADEIAKYRNSNKIMKISYIK